MKAGINYPFHTSKIRLKDAGEVNYIDEGAGPETILFIHGLANYALGWMKNIEYLRQRYRCVAIDLPGNGLSERGDYPFSINYFTDVVIELIEKLGLKNLSLAGHSMGGQIAITAMLREPAIADRLILCAPAGFEVFTPFEMSIYQGGLHFADFFTSEEQSLTKLLRTSFYHNTQQADTMIMDLVELLRGQPLKQYRKMVDACIHGMLHEPVYNSLHLLTCPTLVIFGERDALIPNRLIHPRTTRSIAEEGAGRIPGAELHILQQAGHFVQWEKAERVNQLIDSFLQK